MKTNCLKFLLFTLLFCLPYSCEKANLDEDLEQTDEPNDDDGGGKGSGSSGGTTGKNDGKDEDNPLTVAEFIAGDYEGGVFVKGFIVGACHSNIKYADFEAPFEGSSAILLADTVGETDTDKMISIELKGTQSALRLTFNLKDHPENLGKQARFFGYRTTYLGIIGIKAPTAYRLFD